MGENHQLKLEPSNHSREHGSEICYLNWGFGVAEVLARQAAVQGSIPPIRQNCLSHIEGDSECQVC